MDKYKKISIKHFNICDRYFFIKDTFVFVNAVCNKNDGYGRLRLRRLGSANS